MEGIGKYRDKVNFALKSYLEGKIRQDGRYSPKVRESLENILEFNLRGGKRIRPLATIFAYKCFREDDKIVDASISIELMQSYLLIHDDIMDKADLRRGKPSMHKIYGGEHFGNSMAMLAGNICAAYVYDSIMKTDFSDRQKLNAIKHLSWVDIRENYGQTLDVIPNFENLREKDVMKIYELKTATYTLQGPLYIGCTLADAPKEKVEKLQEYAYNLGVAFQAQDDINGVFGNVEETGKPNDSDIKEGKKTLLIVKTLDFCNRQDKKFILGRYGKNDLNENEMYRIRKIMQGCGALDYCKTRVNKMIEKGKRAIENEDLRAEGKNFLLELADYIKTL